MDENILDYEMTLAVQEISNADPKQAKEILARYLPQVQTRVQEAFRTNDNLRLLFPEYVESIE